MRQQSGVSAPTCQPSALRRRLALALLVAWLLPACGTFEVGVERTPTPDGALAATMTALEDENRRLATEVASFTDPLTSAGVGKVAYVQGGDIWVRAIPSGLPQRLTTDGRNASPRWSPTGGWLAFRKAEGQVWLMREDGTDARPLSGGAIVGEFAWSPRDERLAYATGAGDLRLADPEASQPVTLIQRRADNRGPNEIGRMAWRSDGAEIAFEWRELQETQAGSGGGIWRVSLETGRTAELYRGEAILAGWSGDDAAVLFWEGSAVSSSLTEGLPLLVAPLEGSLSRQPIATTLTYRDFVAPAPDGTNRVALISGTGRGVWTNKTLRVVDVVGREQVTLTPPGQAASSPVWSPDGQQLAYVSAPDRRVDPLETGDAAQRELAQRRLLVVDAAAAGQPRALTDNPAYRDEQPDWSSDGEQVLFARLDTEGRASLWLVSSQGGEPRRVVDELSPSPDWLGYYGHIEWERLYDWWRGPR